MPIILHADDFGITRATTQGIVSAWQDGALDRFSILANGRHLDWGRQLLATCDRQPQRLAIHLNVLEGPPLSTVTECPLLFGRGKNFRFSLISLLRWQKRSAEARQSLSKQIYSEWTKQILLSKKLFPKVKVWSLDSHRHVHVIPWLWEITLKLARQFSIVEIRIPKDRFMQYLNTERIHMPKPWNPVKIRIINHLIEQNFYHRLYSPLFLGGLYYEGEMHRFPIKAAYEKLKQHTEDIEILFHPGDDSPANPEDTLKDHRFYLHPNRKKEWRFLLNLAEKRHQNTSE